MSLVFLIEPLELGCLEILQEIACIGPSGRVVRRELLPALERLAGVQPLAEDPAGKTCAARALPLGVPV